VREVAFIDKPKRLKLVFAGTKQPYFQNVKANSQPNLLMKSSNEREREGTNAAAEDSEILSSATRIRCLPTSVRSMGHSKPQDAIMA
jgi:hypothetical protein